MEASSHDPIDLSEGCVLLGSTAVYRRLMDPTSPCTGPAVSNYIQSTISHQESSGFVRKRFEKSESEDSGVELPPPSPFGSESSYNPDESDSLESSTPEFSESLDNPTLEDHENIITENQGSTGETVILEDSSLKDKGSFRMHPDKDTDTMRFFLTKQRERNTSGVPHKLEQAILRSRRQRSTYREPIQNRTPRYNRQYVGSLKEQRRGNTLSYQTKSPTRQSQENKDSDPLVLPGDGLRYLESLCNMLEQIAELQQKNQRLQQEKKEAEGRLHKKDVEERLHKKDVEERLHKKDVEERLHNQVFFLDSCVCGASRDLENDLTDGPKPNQKTWEPTHYRKRSSSHAGVLLSIARPTDNVLKKAGKMDPQYVSVPNLQEEPGLRRQQNYKPEATQWHRVKEMLSRIAGKGAGPVQGRSQKAEPRNNCRTQTLLEGNPQHPRRLFLPGLVIRPRNHGRQFH
ncbi:uncharacterized protein LOC130367957 isoform X3 [Hyla sarda]|uniref:uncharacterized protein LOC130367957 isoform X3 n=1 Tax=Hyla sarda TaxID=327740 RepID=UPI0024C3E3E8|nr:uncharacterized protein LOC130367957 isoform X3 [Hyla sarda]